MKMTKEQKRNWCKWQRLKYRNGQLTPFQIAKLESLPWWSWAPQGHFKTLEDHVADAERLARENKKNPDMIPSSNELRKTGYSGLDQAMRKYPEAFEHLEQVKARKARKAQKTLEDHVADAKRLARENKKNPDMIPSSRELRKTGYSGLDTALRKYPEAFAHLEQVKARKARKTLEDHVADAKRLARENKENPGMIPSSSELNKTGYSGLDTALRKYPEAFAHLEQVKKINQFG